MDEFIIFVAVFGITYLTTTLVVHALYTGDL